VTTTVVYRKGIFKSENIHPAYYQYLLPDEPVFKPVAVGDDRRLWRDKNLIFIGASLLVVILTLIGVLGSEPSSATASSIELARSPMVQQVRVQRHRYLKRVREIEQNIQSITKVLTYLHGSISEEVGESDQQEHAEPSNADLPTVTVIVPKANLRAEPDIESEAIAAVGDGTQLVLETATGSWFGVIAPSGERSWVRMDLVSVD